MTPFAVETAVLLILAYGVGCVGGCWLRRACTRRHARRG
jgi:hypothetical protein